MLIPTYNLLSKNWDIFATRCCILLIFNPNYFRGGEVNRKKHLYRKGSQIGSLFHFSISQYSMCFVVRLLLKLNWTSFRAEPILWNGVSVSKLG